MNNGKICISVCAGTADKLIEQIKRAVELADIIELRFDCLTESELEKFLFSLNDLRKNFKNEFLVIWMMRERRKEYIILALKF